MILPMNCATASNKLIMLADYHLVFGAWKIFYVQGLNYNSGILFDLFIALCDTTLTDIPHYLHDILTEFFFLPIFHFIYCAEIRYLLWLLLGNYTHKCFGAYQRRVERQSFDLPIAPISERFDTPCDDQRHPGGSPAGIQRQILFLDLHGFLYRGN